MTNEQEQNAEKFLPEELIELAALGELSIEHQANLVKLLVGDAASRAAFVKAIAFEVMLAEELHLERSLGGVVAERDLSSELVENSADDAVKLPITSGFFSENSIGIHSYFRFVAVLPWIATVAVIGILATLFMMLRERENVRDEVLAGRKGLVQPVATVTNTAGGPFSKGERLTTGRLALEDGQVELTMDCGAVVTMVGPASFELLSDYRMLVSNGELSATVPSQAAGFMILTPTSHIVDLGTAFALRVSQDGETEIHVVEGQVEATALGVPKAKKQKLTRAQSARFLKDGVEAMEFDAELFVYPSEKTEGPSNAGLVHWSFNEVDKLSEEKANQYSLELKRLDDRSSLPIVTNGVIGQALHFDGNGGYAQSSYQGVSGDQARTVAFWVRVPIDINKEVGHSVVSWGAPVKSGKWELGLNHIADHGQVGAIRIGFGGGFVIGATDIVDGLWHHVAGVFYGGKNADVSTHVKIYVDGRLEMTTGRRQQAIDTATDSPRSIPVVIGRFIDARSTQIASYFVGDLDEVVIAARAFPQSEIALLKDVSPIR